MNKALLTLAIVTITALAARADIEVAWDVSGHGSPETTLVAQTINSNLTQASGLNELMRNTVLLSAGASAFVSNNWNLTDTLSTDDHYIGFSINPNTTVQLTDLQFAINGSNTAPRNGVWGYSINGGAFTLGTAGDGGAFTITNPTPTTLADWNFLDFSIGSGDTAQFRFFAYGTQPIGTGAASASGGSVRIANIAGNDLVLNGMTGAAVPEPTTIGLIGLGLAGVVAFARRRKA